MSLADMLARMSFMLPEAFEVRRGSGVGTDEAAIIWGDPEPGSFTPVQRAEAMLATPEGKALSALVEATEAWYGARMWAATQPPWPHDEADERIEAAEEAVMAAVDVWLAL